jgi:peptide/nickel transport system substrate-binding protein
MRWRSALAVSFSAVILAAACTQPGTTTAPSGSSGGSAAGSSRPATTRGQGGDLKILYWQPPTILNQHQATGTKDADAARLVLEPLATYGNDGKPVLNGLAAEIPTLENGGVAKDLTTVTWKLAKDVKWSDGTPFTADDVAFTFQYMKDPKTAATTTGDVDGIKSVIAKDANTVVVTYDAPNANYYQWGVACCFILQKAQFGAFIGEKAKDAPGNLKPIGTGPFVVKEFKPGDTVLYEANPNYREASKPFFKTVTFKGGGDAPTAARALFQTSDWDYGWNLQIDATLLRSLIAASTTADFVSVYGNSVERILLNFSNPDPSLGAKRGEPDTKHPFLTDLAVRRALAMATDRNTIAKQIYGDGLAGKPTCDMINNPPQYVGTTAAAMDVCKFDLAAANAELEKAGYTKGADGFRAKGNVKLSVTYATTVNAVRQDVQAIMKKNWESIGVKVELKSVPPGTFFTNTAPDGANHFWYDVEMYTNSGVPDPLLTLRPTWGSGNIASSANSWQGNNYARYSNADYDKLMSDLAAETDTAKRIAIVKKANDFITQNVVVIPLVNRSFATSAKSKTLKGVNPTPWDSEMYNVADWTK